MSSWFVAGSVLVHVAVLTIVGRGAPDAHASPAPRLVEVLIETDAEEPMAIPRGRLTAPVEQRTTVPENEPLPPQPRAQPPAGARSEPTNSPATDQATPPPQPQGLIGTTNPYGDPSFGQFTEGTRTGVSRTVNAKATSAPARVGFGVESGHGEDSEEARRALAAWHAEVQRQLASRAVRAYPVRARKLGQQGTTRIAVTVGPDGQIMSAGLSSGSGHGLLDQAAVEGVAAVGRVSAPPEGVGTARLIVPVTFRLN